MGAIKVFTDGASRRNPGESGIGIIIYDESGSVLAKWNEYIGITTNNQAEYKALLKSIDLISKLEENSSFEMIEFYADSELMVKQIKGLYKVKDKELVQLHREFNRRIRESGSKYNITHIDRSLNKVADKLANMAIDNRNSL